MAGTQNLLITSGPHKRRGRNPSALGAYVRSKMDDIRQWEAAGKTAHEVAELLSIDGLKIQASLVYSSARAEGFRFRRGKPRGEKNPARNDEMARLYREGKTLVEIGSQYGMTRERVRQLLARRGLNWEDGGAHVHAQRSRKLRAAKMEERTLARYGCTLAQRRELLRIHQEMQKQGLTLYQSLMTGFHSKRNWVRRHGQIWQITPWEFWKTWEQSGKWLERGRGDEKYGLARKDKSLPWTVDNVAVMPNKVSRTAPRLKKAA